MFLFDNCLCMPAIMKTVTGSDQARITSDEETMIPEMKSSRKTEAEIKMRATAKKSLASWTQNVRSSFSEFDERRNSQASFMSPEQTVIVFDWDDTLFPTNWVRYEKRLQYRKRLSKQTPRLIPEEVKFIENELSLLEDEVLLLLEEARQLGHVIIVTLAKTPWVELSCKNFFPRVGAFLKLNNIAVCYAQTGEAFDKSKFSSRAEIHQFWSQKKELAIMGEVAKFYASHGSSWKNVISIGDSQFERTATKELLLDYATLTENDFPEVGSSTKKSMKLFPSTSKSRLPDNNAMSGYIGTHYHRMRTKTIKMFDAPDIGDLTNEIQFLHKWLPALVHYDAGFDMDMEDEDQIEEMYDNLKNPLS